MYAYKKERKRTKKKNNLQMNLYSQRFYPNSVYIVSFGSSKMLWSPDKNVVVCHLHLLAIFSHAFSNLVASPALNTALLKTNIETVSESYLCFNSHGMKYVWGHFSVFFFHTWSCAQTKPKDSPRVIWFNTKKNIKVAIAKHYISKLKFCSVASCFCFVFFLFFCQKMLVFRNNAYIQK